MDVSVSELQSEDHYHLSVLTKPTIYNSIGGASFK